MVSYEVSIGTGHHWRADVRAHIVTLGIVARSNLIRFSFWSTSQLARDFSDQRIAENNRAPFDCRKPNQKLVAGFHTDTRGSLVAIFMAEYAAMVVVTAVATTLYLGGWYFPGVYRLTEAHGYHNAYVVASLIVFLLKAGLFAVSISGCAGRCAFSLRFS